MFVIAANSKSDVFTAIRFITKMDVNRLTLDADRAIINRTWIIIDRYRNQIGARIFETIFEQSPDMKQVLMIIIYLFIPFQLFISNDVDIKWSTTIELHQHKFMQVSVVYLIDRIQPFYSQSKLLFNYLIIPPISNRI
jgi:hypothetical protein